jgi:hypothetical protein
MQNEDCWIENEEPGCEAGGSLAMPKKLSVLVDAERLARDRLSQWRSNLWDAGMNPMLRFGLYSPAEGKGFA